MQFVYDARAGEPVLTLEGETFTHVFKSRRTGAEAPLHVRNLVDGKTHLYRLGAITRKHAQAHLEGSVPLPEVVQKELCVGWAMVEQKSIEKVLPSLNEMGVRKIALVRSDFSQGNTKLDFVRLQRILINSSQQCGRGDLLTWERFGSVQAWCEAYPKGVIVDFSSSRLGEEKPEAFLVGCEGGFSPKERALFEGKKVVGLESPYILRSESAVLAMAAKILT